MRNWTEDDYESDEVPEFWEEDVPEYWWADWPEEEYDRQYERARPGE
jgi:hypothetical protein